MSELEDYKNLYDLLKKENETCNELILMQRAFITTCNKINNDQAKIIELQEKMIHDMITRKSVPHLRLV
jgi:hypothetical protein